MTKSLLKFTLLASVITCGFQPVQASAMSDKEKEELGTFVREYLMDNPEVIFESVDKFQKEEKLRAEVAAQETLADSLMDLTAADLPSIGNPDADVTVIEFFDYNCGYCKRALPDIQKLVAADKNVRVVFHEMPILSEASRLAALWALAAHEQGQYFEYHAELMKHRGAKTSDELKKIGKRLKLDVRKLEKDAQSKKVSAALAKSINWANKLGVTGTPAFIVGDEVFKGYIGHDAMKKAIAAQRKG